MAMDSISASVSNAANQAAIAAAAAAATKAATAPTPYAAGTAYNPMYGNAQNTTAAPVVTSSVPGSGSGSSGQNDTSKTPTTYTQAQVDQMIADAKAAATAAATTTAAQTQQTQASNSYDAFRQKFQNIGLGSLADALLGQVTSPNAPTTASGWYSALLATPEYKARFGNTNAMRTANGLPQLQEVDIMKAEQNISDTLRNMGLPPGFYDQPSDFQQFIALDKSAAEVGDIVQAYQDIAKQTDPTIKAQLQTYYGLDTSAIAAYLMDPTKAQPALNALTQKGITAAAAASSGAPDIAGMTQVAGGLGAGSLSYAKQAQAFAQAQQFNQQIGTLANIYGNAYGNYNTAQGLQEALSGPEAVQAANTRQRLTTAEESQFGGSAGASTQGQSLGIGTAQGVS